MTETLGYDTPMTDPQHTLAEEVARLTTENAYLRGLADGLATALDKITGNPPSPPEPEEAPASWPFLGSPE